MPTAIPELAARLVSAIPSAAKLHETEAARPAEENMVYGGRTGRAAQRTSGASHGPPDPRRPRPHAELQGLGAGSRAAHAAEQPRPGGRGAAGGPGRLWRQRQGGARLALVRPDLRDAPVPARRRDPARAERQAGGRVTDARRRSPGVPRQLEPCAEGG